MEGQPGGREQMAPTARLGGFKVLKDVFWFSLHFPKQNQCAPAALCQGIADAKINLPYVTCLKDAHAWGMNVAVEAPEGSRISKIIQTACGPPVTSDPGAAILSIFPHKSDPQITAGLLRALGHEGLGPKAWANSPSAISIVLREENLNRASTALFEPFSFSAYRSPADWKLAQKGKEQLYKEVVASYQEKRPKVYGLNVQGGQELVRIKADGNRMGALGKAFEEFGRLGLQLSFLSTAPCPERGKETLAFCLPQSQEPSLTAVIKGVIGEVEIDNLAPVATFAMNGPHFGDRYGIISGLINAFQDARIDLLGLNCTIASIVGLVPAAETETAIEALQSYFEVPAITRKD